jgi:2-aminoethylphosphonate-pyruvate transaminase
MLEKKMLFSPGPVLTTDRVKKSLLHPDMCHRRPVFEAYVSRIRSNLLSLFKADQTYTAAIISGSGTAANETTLSSIIRDSEEVLLIKNGEFGERLEEILSCYHFQFHTLSYPWGTQPELKDVEKVLEGNEKIQWVCMVYHETSTGMRNPLNEVGKLVCKYQRKLFVDCVSAVGAEPINVLEDHIDVCTGVANKAIGGLPGVSFVIARRSSVPDLGKDVPRRNIYLNLQKHIEMADHWNQTPNTPAVNMFVALDAVLQEVIEEGLEARIRMYQQCARIIRDGVKELQLRTLIPEKYSGNTVTSVFLPPELHLEEFIDELDRRGYVVYPGKRHLYQENMFQIANMGDIHPKDCDEFLHVMKDVIEGMYINLKHVTS